MDTAKWKSFPNELSFMSPVLWCVGHETNWLPSPPKFTALVGLSLTFRLNRGYQRVTAVKARV